MQFALTEEQQAIRQMARRFLAERAGTAVVRDLMAGETGFDSAVWTRVCEELGWPGILVPEEYGGFGLGMIELSVVLEEAGRALFCGPLFSSTCLGVAPVLCVADAAQKEVLLPELAGGETRATLALMGPGESWDLSSVTMTAEPVDGGVVLQGDKTLVVDGATADHLLVVARLPGTSGLEGLTLCRVSSRASGLSRTPRPTMDQTRKMADLTLDGVEVPTADCLGGVGAAGPGLARALAWARIGLAAEQVGGAEQVMDLSVAYAKVREQFSRPIGSFQAVKHKCADMLLQVESARSAALWAAWVASLALDAPEAGELQVAAGVAAAYCGDAFFSCAAEAIQVHGGIGFTWEHDAHIHFKRARASRDLLGRPSAARETLAAHLGL